MATDTGFGIVRFFDDFQGDTLDANYWVATANGGGTAPVHVSTVNGVVVSTLDTGDGDLCSLLGPDVWTPATQGTIVFEARVLLSTSLTQGVFIGFHDNESETNVMPFDFNGGTYASTSSDGVGFLYDVEEGSDWYCVSVKADSDGAQTDSLVAPVLDTWQTFRITIELNGDIRYYINGKEITESGAARTTAITTTTALGVAIAHLSSGVAGVVKVDYVYVSGGRV